MFENRHQAGKLLAQKLLHYKSKGNVYVLGIPRGGIPVAFVVSKKLNLPLSFIVTRKIGAPGQKELAIGAIGPEGVKVLDEDLISRLKVSNKYLETEIKKQRKELEKRIRKFSLKKGLVLKGKIIILVDDGIATGATVEAAVKYLKKKRVKKIVLATPVSAKDSADKLGKLVDELVVINIPFTFFAVGQFYRNFPQVTNEEVLQFLKDA